MGPTEYVERAAELVAARSRIDELESKVINLAAKNEDLERRSKIILNKLDGAAQDITYHKKQLERLLNEQG